MKYSYLKACIAAGLSEDKIKEIERFFDKEKKTLKDQKRKRFQYYGVRFSVSDTSFNDEDDGDDDTSDLDIPNVDRSPEETVVFNFEMDILYQTLSRLPEEDLDFIMTYFGEADENLSKLARMFDMPRSTASDKFKRLMKNIKKDFFNSCPGDYSMAFLK